MPIFNVTRKSDGVVVYEYTADVPIEWSGFEFAEYDHVEVPVPSGPPPAVIPAEQWHIYPGPFKDRLGMDGLAIAASTHPVCVAAREMLNGRLYIDLKSAKSSALLDMLIAAQQPAASPYFPGSGPMTSAKKALILDTPTTEAERYRG